MFSMCLILPTFFIMGLLVNMKFNSKVFLALLGFCAIIMEGTLRNPMILLMTIKRNELNQAIANQEELREQKRQFEVAQAIKERDLRKQNNPKNLDIFHVA